jgi:tetratricopeptide (TPR) repeat protein
MNGHYGQMTNDTQNQGSSSEGKNEASPTGTEASDFPEGRTPADGIESGVLWFLGGTAMTAMIYLAAMNSPGGVTRTIAWSAVVFGAIQFFRALAGVDQDAQYRAEAHELLNLADLLERGEPAKAMATYQEIIRLYPETAASNEARRHILTLNARRRA